MEQKRGWRGVPPSAADMWIGDLRGHGFSDFQPGNVVAEIAGTTNRMKAHDACLLYTVRLIWINVLELYVMSVSRGCLGNRSPNSMLHAWRIGGRIWRIW